MEPFALSIPETGKALGGAGDPLSRDTIYRMINRGDLEAFKLGARTFIKTESIKALIANASRLGVA